jgi:LuxR family quorum-sensing system transcriptional regulator SinR
MAQSGAYFELLDWLDQQETIDPPAFLSRLQVAYETGPITYIDAVISNGRMRAHTIHRSHRRHAPNSMRSQHRKPPVDQILRVFAALEPILLVSKNRGDEYGPITIGYPLPGRNSGLLVEAGPHIPELSIWRRLHDRDLLSLGTRLNARLTRPARMESLEKSGEQSLTRRERETLAWIAAGKSYWETAVILGISERTIRHFMANARRKLDVMTNAQAVAEAVWRDLIPRLADTEASSEKAKLS